MVDQRRDGLAEGLLPLRVLIFSDWSLIWSLTFCLESWLTELHLLSSLQIADISAGPQAALYENRLRSLLIKIYIFFKIK